MGGGGGQVCQTPLATAYTGLGGNGGAITRLGVKITNASHPIVGVPITDASFWLSKSGSPTGLGTVAIYNSVGVLQATSTTTLDWATLSGSLTKYTFGGFSYTVNNGDFIMVQGGSTGIGNEVSVGANENAGDIAYQCYAKYCDGSGTCGAAGFYEINSGTSDCHFCWDS